VSGYRANFGSIELTTSLPPLNALKVFEAVARCGTVRGAADELNVVHGAISQQIKALEEHLGLSLFARKGRRLFLTKKGQRFADAVRAALGIIERAAAELRPTGGRAAFRLGVRPEFAAFWLMPRLPSFNGGFDLDIVTVPTSPVFFEDNALDALIAGSDYQPRPELVATEFMEDGFGPVAAPAIAAALESAPALLARAVAISARPSPELWDNWFHESGVAPVRFRRRIEFDTLMLCLRAAAAGLGVAMAPRATAEAAILAGELVAPFGFILRRRGYRFCCRTVDVDTPPFRAVRAWLEELGRYRFPNEGQSSPNRSRR
jgi:DNA-binding transcriptional LysR family regulator